MTPDAATRLALLLGDPVGHSLSPTIHNAAFRAAGVNAVYLATRVPPTGLGAAVAGLRGLGVLGANVTVPHKEAVIPHLDALAEEATAIGAVNTIVRGGAGEEGGGLTGHNTDARGFLRPLDLEEEGGEAVVFGSGGGARAATYALLTAKRPVALTLVARTPPRAEALAQHLARFDARGGLRVVPPSEASSLIRRADIIVNATPLGMAPRPEGTPWPTAADFGPHQTVYDLVYNPRRTRLLADAARRGARTVDGLAMLIGQAAEAFQLWTGRPMPLEAVYAALAPPPAAE